MKTAFTINLYVIIITLIGYLGLWLGILFQIVLGAIQIVYFFYFLYHLKVIPSKIRFLLYTYGLITGVLIGYVILDTDHFIILWPLSGFLALFFLYICHCLQIHFKRIHNPSNTSI